jgi:beta propeller repeat protein
MNPIVRKTLLVVAAAAAVGSATGCAAERLDPNASDQLSPSFNGDAVVWEDSRNDLQPPDPTDGTDVYMYSVSAGGSDIKVAGGSGEQDQPAISDQYVVWIDEGRLMARALPLSPTNPAFPVTNGSPTQTDPYICGSLVVWSDTGNNSDVKAKQLPNGQEIQVATSSAVEAYPACDGGRVVYMYAPLGAQSDIRLYDVGTGQTTTVAGHPWNEWRPTISGNRVVWQALTSDIQIYGKDLSTNQDFVVSEAAGNQTAPAISGSTVAWQDMRSGTPQIWWRDLATTMPQIPVDSTLARPDGTPADQEEPSLVGRSVVFQSDAAGPWNIYAAQLFFFTRQ